MPDATIHGIEFEIRGNADRAASSIDRMVSSLTRLKAVAGGISTLARGMATGLKSIGSAALHGSARLLAFQKSLLALPLTSVAKNMAGFASRIGAVVAGFKRILRYRIMRSIIRKIGQAFKEGTQNLYQYSAALGGTFAANMNDAATSMLYFKNSLGAAWSPLMNVLAPAIRVVTDAAVELLNVINQLIALLTGASGWTRATRVAKEYGDAVGGAGGAAKKALEYLAPFDELNVLPDEKQGGGGGSNTDYGSMFEEMTEFETGIADFANRIREAVQNADWQGLGTLLGDKVNEVIESIPFGELGAKVGEKINAFFTTRYWTLDTINFQNIGARIAEFLNNAISNIDFDVLGRTFTQKFTIIGDLLIGAVTNIDWAGVGNAVGDYLRGAFDKASEWLASIDWAGLGSDIYVMLKDAIEGTDFDSLASSFFRALGSALGAAVGALAGFIKGVWEDIKDYFRQYIPDGATWAENGAEIIAGIFQGIVDAISNVGTWIREHIFQPFIDGFKNVFGIHSPASTMNEPGQQIGNGILDGIAAPFKAIGDWIKEHIFDPIKNAIKNFKDSPIVEVAVNLAKKAWDTVTGWVNSAAQWGKEKIEAGVGLVKNAWTTVTGWVNTAAQWGKEKIEAAVGVVKGWTGKLKDWITGEDGGKNGQVTGPAALISRVKNWTKSFKEWLGGTSGQVTGPTALISRTKNWTTTFKEWITGKTDGKLTGVTALISRVKNWTTTFKEWIGGSKGQVTGPSALISRAKNWTTTFKEWISGKSDGTFGGITALISRAKNWTGTMKEWISGSSDGKFGGISGLVDLVRNGWSTVANWILNNFMGGAVQKGIDLIQTGWGTVSNWLNGNNQRGSGSVDAGVNLTRGTGYGIGGIWNTVLDYVRGLFGSGTVTVPVDLTYRGGAGRAAAGGVLSGGIWHSIPQYAGGTRNAHGSLFIAGEAGPEVVGHIGGRTEVLNRSQLAATMYSAVSSAMAGLRFQVQTEGYGADEEETEDTMYRAFRRALAETDFGGDVSVNIDSDPIYTSVVRRNRQETYRTGVNPMMAMA